ncbi:MAG: hypothetical protein WAU52_14875, partial [Burkholderiales bacterium]
MGRRATTLQQLCVARAGVYRGSLLAAYLVQMAMAQRDLGRFPSNAEYAEWWAISKRGVEEQRRKLRAAGFTDDEIVQYVGQLAAVIDVRASRSQMLKLP